MVDWLATLREQIELGKQMAREVPQTLADPAVTLEQVNRLFRALEHQAQFTEKLTQVLEDNGHDFAVVEAAKALEELFADLAVAAAEKLKQLRTWRPATG